MGHEVSAFCRGNDHHHNSSNNASMRAFKVWAGDPCASLKYRTLTHIISHPTASPNANMRPLI